MIRNNYPCRRSFSSFSQFDFIPFPRFHSFLTDAYSDERNCTNTCNFQRNKSIFYYKKETKKKKKKKIDFLKISNCPDPLRILRAPRMSVGGRQGVVESFANFTPRWRTREFAFAESLSLSLFVSFFFFSRLSFVISATEVSFLFARVS